MRKFVFVALMSALFLPASASRAETSEESAMAQQIGRELKESGQLRNYRIGIEYQDGIAVLNGSVTSEEQRDAAIRLAEQVQGVSHVVSKLSFPGEGATAINEAQLASTQAEPSNVMHAYGNNMPAAAAPIRRAPRPSPAGMRPNMNRIPARNNMPLPSQMSNGAGRPVVRQASAQGIYESAAAYPEACPPGGMGGGMATGAGGAVPVGFVPHGHGRGPSYENAQMPGYAWPSYASYPNYAALTYPKQYSPTAWPYIGPFYPYPQVPLAWRKVSLEWDDGWWFLDFSAHNSSH
jgi:BON domain-containing protein